MNKKPIFVLSVTCMLLIFSACIPIRTTEPRLAYRMEEISLMDETLKVEFFLERPDLFLSEPYSEFNLNINELPLGVQPEKLILFSAENNSEIECKTDILPHYCEIPVDSMDFEDKQKVKTLENYILKANFKDGLSSETPFVIPYLLYLEKPEILMPDNDTDDKSILKFREIGAEEYSISVALCYNSDEEGGACLKGNEYEIVRDGKLLSLNETPEYFNAVMTYMNDEITLDFEFDSTGYDMIIYEVQALLQGTSYRAAEVYFGSTARKELFLN